MTQQELRCYAALVGGFIGGMIAALAVTLTLTSTPLLAALLTGLGGVGGALVSFGTADACK